MRNRDLPRYAVPAPEYLCTVPEDVLAPGLHDLDPTLLQTIREYLTARDCADRLPILDGAS